MKRHHVLLMVMVCFGAVMLLSPDLAMAQFAGELQTKVQGITNGLIDFILPAAACIGIVYAAILASIGDASAKQRMILVLVASAVGMLAPLIIHWIQGMTR